MPVSKRNHYSQDFKDIAVKRTLALSKKTIKSIAEEINVNQNTLYNWIHQNKKQNLQDTEDNEIHELKLRLDNLEAENKYLRKECAILKQTASFYFSKKAD